MDLRIISADRFATIATIALGFAARIGFGPQMHLRLSSIRPLTRIVGRLHLVQAAYTSVRHLR